VTYVQTHKDKNLKTSLLELLISAKKDKRRIINPVITLLVIKQSLDKSPFAIDKIVLCNFGGVVIMLNQCTQREHLLKTYTMLLIGASKKIIQQQNIALSSLYKF